MSIVDIFEKIMPVLMAGLFFGAGLPALYAFGMRLLSGTTEYTADGRLIEIEPPHPVAKVFAYIIFVAIIGVIIAGILWIANDFIHHMTGIDIFGTAGK